MILELKKHTLLNTDHIAFTKPHTDYGFSFIRIYFIGEGFVDIDDEQYEIVKSALENEQKSIHFARFFK